MVDNNSEVPAQENNYLFTTYMQMLKRKHLKMKGWNRRRIKVNHTSIQNRDPCSYEHKIRVFGQTKTGQVDHLSEQRHVWSVMLLCNYQSSTTRNELMSAQTALNTD